MIFDLDGTLIDSRLDIANALNQALNTEGFSQLPIEQIVSFVGRGAGTLVREAMGPHSAEDFQRVFLKFLEVYQQNILVETKLYEGALQFIEKSSHWQRAIVTNKPLKHTQEILSRLHLNQYFRWVIGADSLPVYKPDPGVMVPIQQELGEWETGVMIGDSIIDIQLAKRVGLVSVALTHGFGTQEELALAEPDFIVSDFKELSSLPIFN